MLPVWKVLAAAGCALLAQFAPALAQDELETAIKATYLYKFAPFVEWPEKSEAGIVDQPDTFDICVVGDDPFGDVLDEATAGQRVRSQHIRIRRFPAVKGGAAGCEIMYVAGSEIQPVAEALAEVAGHPTLTVTDGERASKSHGIIHFVEQNGRIRFRIDDVMAGESGLVISSKLLDLAVSVRTRSIPMRLR